MAIAFVRQDTFTSPTSGTTFAFVQGVTPTAGNLNVLCWGFPSISASIVNSITQTNVGPWARAVRSAVNNTVDQWYGIIGASPSATLNGVVSSDYSASAARANVAEFSGLDPTAPFVSGTANNGNSATPITGSVTPTAGTHVVLVAAARRAGTFVSLDTAGWTALSTASTGTQYAYLIVPSASGSYSCQWTWGTSGLWDTTISIFQAPSATGWGPLLGNENNRLVRAA